MALGNSARRGDALPNSVPRTRSLTREDGGRGEAHRRTADGGATPDSLLALHDAGYREVVARLGPGVVVDIGCGIGAETERLGAPDRLVIGADYSSDTVRLASRTYDAEPPGSTSLRATAPCSGCRDRSVDYAVSSHIIEHFVNPALHVIELARAAPTAPRSSSRPTRRPTSRIRSTCTCSSPSISCRCSRSSSTT